MDKGNRRNAPRFVVAMVATDSPGSANARASSDRLGLISSPTTTPSQSVNYMGNDDNAAAAAPLGWEAQSAWAPASPAAAGWAASEAETAPLPALW